MAPPKTLPRKDGLNVYEVYLKGQERDSTTVPAESPSRARDKAFGAFGLEYCPTEVEAEEECSNTLPCPDHGPGEGDFCEELVTYTEECGRRSPCKFHGDPLIESVTRWVWDHENNQPEEVEA